MRQYQARPKWDLERAIRRRMLIDTTLRVAAIAALVVVTFWLTVLTLWLVG
jgi:hypothetical protein